MAEVSLSFDQKVAVKSSGGELLYWVNPSSARRLIRKQLVIPFGTGRHVRAVVAIERTCSELPSGPDKAVSIQQYTGQRYSHNHETQDNPEKVWTLRRLGNSLAPIFRQVIADCIPKRKAKVLEFKRPAKQDRAALRKAA